jgi:hypothetical protein
MVKMAALAPMGIFEEEDWCAVCVDEAPYERHFDDYSRNYEQAA